MSHRDPLFADRLPAFQAAFPALDDAAGRFFTLTQFRTEKRFHTFPELLKAETRNRAASRSRPCQDQTVRRLSLSAFVPGADRLIHQLSRRQK
ncbi:hypothetical protein, partial [Brevundimonas naejangsanensis]